MSSGITERARRAFVLALVAACALAQTPAHARRQESSNRSVPDTARLRAHVSHLASDKLEGRKTGTPGAQAAARYIAEEFRRFGLAPGGNADRDYLQTFPYVAAVELGRANAMTLISPAAGAPRPATLDLRVGEDWMPLGFSSSARVETTMVAFVAYGITSPEQKYDDYAGADARGNVALALAGSPDGDNPHGRFTRASELRFKAAAARAAGARALVVVAREDNFKDERLARLAYDNAGGDAGLPVVVISRQAAAQVLGLGGVAQLKEFEDKVRASKSAAAGQPEGLGEAAKLPPPGTALTISTDVVRRDAPAANVVGVLAGSDPKLKDEVIVVGAHYDHLGRGGRGSLAAREGEVHHGADDNASGVAALLELARLSAQQPKLARRTVVFVAFAGEEEGLLGSNYYVNHPPHPLERTVAMINLDMVGRLRDDVLMVGGVGTASEWRKLVEAANKGYDVTVDPAAVGAADAAVAEGPQPTPVPADDRPPRPKPEQVPIVITGTNGRVVATAVPAPRFTLRMNEDGFGPSDHSSFYARRVPVLFFFTGTHEDYHKPSDTADRLNYDGLASVVGFVRDIVGGLQARDKRPTYAVSRAESTARSTGFNVYLGTIPTYGESSDGLKLDGVRPGSPAEKAGLRAGDLIVKLAGRDVRNVYDYTQALSAMKAGQEYEVELLRAGQRLTLKVTPTARK